MNHAKKVAIFLTFNAIFTCLVSLSLLQFLNSERIYLAPIVWFGVLLLIMVNGGITLGVLFIIKDLSAQLSQFPKKIESFCELLQLSTTEIKSLNSKIYDKSQSQHHHLQESILDVADVSSHTNQLVDVLTPLTQFNLNIQQHIKDLTLKNDSMIGLFDEITDGHNEFIKNIFQNNQDIHQLNEGLKEARDKNTLVNNLIFQIKLLSFNASVEAAKIGVKGNGFTVIAEELSKLADSSKSSISEVTDKFNATINRLEGFVLKNQNSLEKMVHDSNRKIDQGLMISGDFKSHLETVKDNNKQMETSLNEINRLTQIYLSQLFKLSNGINQIKSDFDNTQSFHQDLDQFNDEIDKQNKNLVEELASIEKIINGSSTRQISNPGVKTEILNLTSTTTVEPKTVIQDQLQDENIDD